ncbi:hypothetical protein SRB5_37880 [Streptomyces sp. RB5]|uniref:FAD dependent oxidoreductase domain-containing protein n=1 Tax=Streptomyces smaragdinus TaxID=2585196 RepID=A0A7K0CJJ9_9ACTN|nr:FAD-binding oxidoreductase [Streptomyces smaragdinus]MQY13638.1 hypothetical protein [Streptomyces smaragdinus]
MRVAVIGAGILGACVGWNLARRGAGVVFLDAGRPGEGVTDWSFAWVNASNKTVRRSYFDLNVAGMAAYRALAEAVGPDGWWYPDGHLRWAGDPDAEAKLLGTGELLVRWGYRVEEFTGAEVRRRLEPAVAVPDGARVLYYPDEAWVHGRRLVGRLVESAAGAEHRWDTAVDGIDGRTLTLSDGTRLTADAIVNAAGPHASRIAALVARGLPMRREPGLVTRLTCTRVPVNRALHAPRIEIRPDGDASVALHSREIDARLDREDPADLPRHLHELARAVVPPLADARITGSRTSNRPIPSDGFPSVGAMPTVPGYYEAVTHSGITLGPVLGRLLAEEILDGTRADLLGDFRPERFTASAR